MRVAECRPRVHVATLSATTFHQVIVETPAIAALHDGVTDVGPATTTRFVNTAGRADE